VDQDVFLTILTKAMEIERDGFQFYRLAAERAEDAGARETFEHLAAEERRHHEALQHQVRAVLERGTWDAGAVPREDRSLDPSGDVFSDGFRRRIQGRHLEMSALSIGILLERNAIDFYTRQADEAESEDVRRFFRELADWETEHYRMLLRQDEALRDDYWAENRFAPLD